MYRHILISTDGSEVAGKGLEQGLDLAKSLGAQVTIVTVTESFPVYAASAETAWYPGPHEIESYETWQIEAAKQVLVAAKAAADKLGVAAEVIHVPNARPADAIVETAKSQGCDLIAMSSNGRRGLQRMLLGSQTADVLVHSPVPVLVVR